MSTKTENLLCGFHQGGDYHGREAAVPVGLTHRAMSKLVLWSLTTKNSSDVLLCAHACRSMQRTAQH